jgi:hypothetical protein
MISRSQMNRQLYQMGGEGMQEGIMQMAPQEMQSQMQPMQDQSMQPQMQSMQAPLQDQGQPQMDPNQAIEILVRMLMEQGIPQEEAIKIAMQMIQAVSEGGMQEVSDDTRIEARFGGRIGYAEGGISNVDKAREMLQRRAPNGEFLAYINPQEAGILKALGGAGQDINGTGVPSFFVKKIFKGVTKAVSGAVKGVANVVKKVASSDLGKIALAAAAIYAGGGGFGLQPGGFSMFGNASGGAGLLGSGGQFGLGNSFLGQSLLGTPNFIGEYEGGPFSTVGNLFSGRSAGGFSKLLSGNTGSLIAGGAGLLTGALSGGQPEQQPGESMEDYNRRVEQWRTTLNANLQNTSGASRYQLPSSANNPYYGVRAANGGRIGYQEGGIGNVITQATQEAFFGQPQMPMMANGGRMGYAMGNSVQQGIMAAPQIANQMDMPVGTPRMNEGGVPELDYRDEGGFVPPIGIKERADDIPAMLSNNEFVFTADAVKNADPEGEKDPERGAREMYVLMKRLENGGVA